MLLLYAVGSLVNEEGDVFVSQCLDGLLELALVFGFVVESGGPS